MVGLVESFGSGRLIKNIFLKKEEKHVLLDAEKTFTFSGKDKDFITLNFFSVKDKHITQKLTWGQQTMQSSSPPLAGTSDHFLIQISVFIHRVKKPLRASLVAQWLRIRLPMQGTWVRALIWEDPTCRGAHVCQNYWACAPQPASHNYWARTPRAHAPQQENPLQWEAHAPQWRVAPARCN